MDSPETQSVLQRKTSLGKKEHEVRVMSITKAIRLAIAKLGNEIFDTPISAISLITQEHRGADLGDLIDDTALLTLLDGQDGRVGAAIIAEPLVGGLIQQQTMGQVFAPGGEPRKMTNTDAAMCAPLLNEIFKRAAPMLQDETEKKIFHNYSFGARVPDSRRLCIALEAVDYFVIRVTLDLAAGARQGELMLILPIITQEEQLADDPAQEGATGKPKNDMVDVVMDLPAELNVVLCKLSLELAQVERLAVGQVLKLPLNTFPETTIATQTGKIIGKGTLGQVDGVRAVRLKRAPVHSKQPYRREEDLADLDLPRMDDLPLHQSEHSTAKPAAITAQKAMPMSDLGGESLPEPAPLERSNTDTAATSAPDLMDIPELDDLPDLADLPELSQISA